jgi:hypothetical protein
MDQCRGVISEPHIIKDYYGDNHVFVLASDNSTYDYYFGTWNSIAGVVLSDPYPITNDTTSKMQILVTGSDTALWVNTQDVSPTQTLTGVWKSLGGQILSNPTAVFDPANTDLLYALVIGMDNNVWIRSLDLKDFSGSWGRVTSSGTVTLDPSAIFDSQKRMHIFVTGSDGAMWLYKLNTQSLAGQWKSLGGGPGRREYYSGSALSGH